MRRTVFLVLVLALVGAGGFLALVPLSRGTGETPDATVPRDFTISSDPTVAVLQMTFIGSFDGERAIYSLFGDGRFRVERRTRFGDLVKEAETEYPFTEVERLVRVAVDHGLADAAQDDLEPVFRQLQPTTDLGSARVELRLATYTRKGEERGAVEQRLRIPPPRFTNHHHPGNDLVAGLAEIEEFFFFEGRRLLGEDGGER
jgi:hypothetical protein